MSDAAGPRSYRDGDIILVDRDREPAAGDLVVVRLPGSTGSRFRQLVVEDGRRMLLALNPAWRPRCVELPLDAEMLGRVVGLWLPEAGPPGLEVDPLDGPREGCES